MIEIELFCRIVEAEIRREHTEHLKEIKRLPVLQDLPEITPFPEGSDWSSLGIFGKIAWRIRHRREVRARRKAERRRPVSVDDRLLKGYSQGIDSALKVLTKELAAFEKRLEREDKGL